MSLWHLWLVETQPPESGGQLSWLFLKRPAGRGCGILGNEFPYMAARGRWNTREAQAVVK